MVKRSKDRYVFANSTKHLLRAEKHYHNGPALYTAISSPKLRLVSGVSWHIYWLYRSSRFGQGDEEQGWNPWKIGLAEPHVLIRQALRQLLAGEKDIAVVVHAILSLTAELLVLFGITPFRILPQLPLAPSRFVKV